MPSEKGRLDFNVAMSGGTYTGKPCLICILWRYKVDYHVDKIGICIVTKKMIQGMNKGSPIPICILWIYIYIL